MSGRGSADRRRTARPQFSSSEPGCESLTGLDVRVLSVLSAHRVVTQDQLARLFPEIPPRTLRYRTRRLHDLGLAGRSRPYRERGSAPSHHWPTRRADALIRGDPRPRGGERKAPNPVFLAHAALLSELYVTLTTQAEQAGLSLREFRREGDAREPFKELGKEHALAPDALLVLADQHGRELRAFVELDLGTMSHPRLHMKAELYAAYARTQAWGQRHPFAPALLFLTTTEPRAVKFLRTLRAALKNQQRNWNPATLTAGAGALAFRPALLLSDGCLGDLSGSEDLALVDVLHAARLPYDQARQAQQERRAEEEQKCRQLREDPTAMREHLRRHEQSLRSYLDALGPVGKQSMELLLGATDPPDVDERAVLGSIARDLDTALLEPGMNTLPSPGASVVFDVKLLADALRSRQGKLVETLAGRYWDGPSLRQARRTLRGGGLIERDAINRLPADAERDARGRKAQAARRVVYLEWREHAARRLARQAGVLGRLTRPSAGFYSQLDQEHLKVCGRCEETVYPAEQEDQLIHDQRRTSPCHYCGEGYQLRAYTDPTESTP